MSAWFRAHWSRVVSGVALAAVAAVAGIISYDHIESLTLALHQPLIVARLMPFGVDGLIMVGSVVLLTATPGTEWLGWLGVGPGVAASVFANVESGIRYGWLAAVWAGVPAGSFFLACFLLERWLKAQASRPATVADGGSGSASVSSPERRGGPLLVPLSATPAAPWPGWLASGPGNLPEGTGEPLSQVPPEPPASHPEPSDSQSEPPASQCPHAAPGTADEAITAHYLHARDCLGEPVSQRQLAAAFGVSRAKVADLLRPLNGHQLDDDQADEAAA